MKTVRLEEISDYAQVEGVLSEQLEQFGSANAVFEHLGQASIAKALKDAAPISFEAIKRLHKFLDLKGAVVLNYTGVEDMPDQLAQLTSICISSVFGQPTRTDKQNSQIAWPIHYDPDVNITPTFSQSLGEAAFHSDTQYYVKPEKYFGLFCKVADRPGRGTNLLLNGEQAVIAFQKEHGDKLATELCKPYPFRVPSAFTETASDEDVEINWAPIYDPASKQIRYRKDTTIKALEQPEVEISSTQLAALEGFDDILHELTPISYHLEPGDAILVNNHTMLHARTDFDNPARFLYRVRMDDVR